MWIGHYMQPHKWVTFCGISYEEWTDRRHTPRHHVEQEICWKVPYPGQHPWRPYNVAFTQCEVCSERAALGQLAETDL